MNKENYFMKQKFHCSAGMVVSPQGLQSRALVPLGVFKAK